MIRSGDSIENPVTGERLVFHQTSADTRGERVVFETFVRPTCFVAAAHVHPFQEERFQVLTGSVGFRIGGKRRNAGPGERLVVPPGTAHRFWNDGDDVARFLCEVRPALQFEQLIETMFGLHHFHDVRLPFPPSWVQRIGLALGAPLGRLLGYQATFALDLIPEAVPEAA
jgi:quercetin dioxygenase-like cupin family protein